MSRSTPGLGAAAVVPTLAVRCRTCDAVVQLPFRAEGKLNCSACGAELARLPPADRIFAQCPFCAYDGFYRQKDFNKVLGLGVIVVAALAVPWTYGLSMPLAALIDAWLYRRTPELVRCYGCRAEFRGFPFPPGLRGYDHYKAELADQRRGEAPARP